MSGVGLKATIREGKGKGVARKLRAQGQIPAIVYGVGESTKVALEAKAVEQILHAHGGENAVIDLDMAGTKKRVIIRDHQSHWSRGYLLHCDLLELQQGHKVNVTVSIEIVGETPLGVRESQGILQHQMHEIQIDVLPDSIPEILQLDASALDVGESLHVSDLNLPEGVHVHASEESAICTVLASKVKDDEDEAGEEASDDEAAPEE